MRENRTFNPDDVVVKPHIRLKKRPTVEVKPHIEVQKIPRILLDVEPIEESGLVIQERRNLKKIVEYPLLSACEELYDKNIQTRFSSANKKHIYTDKIEPAYIDINYETLSEENKKIAEQLGKLYRERNEQSIRIYIPIKNSDSVMDIRKKAEFIVGQFKKQPVPAYTLEQAKTKLLSLKPEEQMTHGDVERLKENFYYDQKNDIFYLSEEQYKKNQVKSH